MTQPITTDPDLMRQIAADHDAVAEQIDAARTQADQVIPAVSSWGPIMWRSKAAAADVLARHEQSLLQEADHHRRMSEQLRARAAAFEQTDDSNAAAIAGLS